MEKLLLFIPIENIGLEKYVQTLSFFAILSIFISPILLILYKIKKSSIFNIFLILIGWLVCSTGFNIIFRLNFQENLLRALSGLIFGFFVFILLREIFCKSNERNLFRGLYYSFIIVLIFFIYDLFFQFHKTFRIFACYTEPSHLGTDLSLIYIPMFILYSKYMSRIKKVFIFLLLLTIVLLTFSGTAYIKVLFFLILYLIFGIKKIKEFVIYSFFIALIVSVSILIFFNLYTNNYFLSMMRWTINSIEKGYEFLPVSITDRMSFWIFLLNIKNITVPIDTFLKFIIGGGVGNDLLFLKFLPTTVASQIICVKAFGSYITSFWGRIFSYGGIIGFILYFIFIFSIYKKIKLTSFTSKEKAVLFSWLITLILASSFDLAPFQTVALWLLPAYVDGINLKSKQFLFQNDIKV